MVSAMSSSACSEKWRPTTCRPIGNPSSVPAGIEMAALPCRFAGKVSLPLLPAPATIPPNSFGSGPSASNATSGLLAVITKSTPAAGSKISAMRSLSSIRRRSILARASMPYRCGASSSPPRISGVSTSAHSGHASASSVAMLIIPLMLHAAPIDGSDVSRSTRANPSSRTRCSPYSSSCAHIAGDTTAPPQSGANTTRAPRRDSTWVPRSRSQPSTRWRLNWSRGSCPLHTSNQRAVSRTLRAIGPMLTV